MSALDPGGQMTSYVIHPGEQIARDEPAFFRYTIEVATLLILYLIFGALLIFLSIPLLLGKIKPNGLYGFRVQATMSNPKIWYAVNRHSAKRILASGIAIILAAILLYWVPNISLDQYAMGVLLVFVVVFGTGIVQSVRFLKEQVNDSATNISKDI